MWSEYLWIVIIGGFLCFFMAYGIGANDVANAFATSVGSRTLTMFQAVILAAIFEFAGALLLGRGVSKTISKGLADPEYFQDIPEVLMWGMFSALFAAGTWLLIATALEMPVSTTHSIVGGVLGFALVAKGREAVIWAEIDEDEIFPLQGVAAVVISWVFSPVCSGIIAAFFFWVVRTFILRSKNSFDRAWMFLPVLVGICFFINAFYVLDKGVSKQWEDSTTEKSAWIGAIIGVATAVATIPVVLFLRKRVLAQQDKVEQEMKAVQDAGEEVPEEKDFALKQKEKMEEQAANGSSFFAKLQNAVNSNDPHKTTEGDEKTAAIHAHAEKFEPRTEGVFRYLQVLTSCADSFAHGANDVANAVGPYATIYGVYKYADFEETPDTPEWILVLGGAGIVVGLATFGWHIIRAIGVKLCAITPSRGFAIELGSALVVVTGSYLGLPLSTTHCQVGATLFVGLLEGHKGVSWGVLLKTAIGWVITLLVAGFLSALVMALGVFTPNLRAVENEALFKTQVNETVFEVTEALSAGCPRAVQDVSADFQAVSQNVVSGFQHPNRLVGLVQYIGEYTADNADGACAATELPAYVTQLGSTTYEPPEEEE